MRWLIVVAIALVLIEVATFVYTNDMVIRWFSVATMVIVAGAVPKFLYWDRRRLLQAEKLNQELATKEGPNGNEKYRI